MNDDSVTIILLGDSAGAQNNEKAVVLCDYPISQVFFFFVCSPDADTEVKTMIMMVS